MDKAQFLWVDDEIDLLKPYVLFLEEKGYLMKCVNNGREALELCRTHFFDIVFLDEHMPGLSGLETLAGIHALQPDMPVVMITKSEDEGIMDQAISSKITDYLIKPVNPNQVLMAIKKILDKKELISKAATGNYRDRYNQLSVEIGSSRLPNDWISVYKELVYWEMVLDQIQSPMKEMLFAQKAEAGRLFAKFVRKRYGEWMINCTSRPVMSHGLFEKFVFPILEKNEKLFFILIDNFRFDQWQSIKDIVSEYFSCNETLYFSILPTATPYARNAIFSGLMPKQISETYPEMWIDETDQEGKNMMEERLIHEHLLRSGRDVKFSYHKVNTNLEGEKLNARFSELESKSLNIAVFNFIDMLAHSRTESRMIRELSPDESAYRSLTKTWFLHSPLLKLFKDISRKGYRAVLTTDHGAIRVKNGVKVIGDRETNVNLRYKLGRNLAYDPKRVFDIIHPENFGLPSPDITTRYIFAQNDDFFVYPNNYNHYASFYGNTFQHGGISLEEMLVPFVTLSPR